MKELTETEKAYLAGFVDGEGCIGIYTDSVSSSISKVPMPIRKKYHSLKVIVASTDKAILHYIGKLTGVGAIRCCNQTEPANKKLLYRWTVQDKGAERFLRAIHPYLKIKRQQSAVVLSMRAINGMAVAKLGVRQWNRMNPIPDFLLGLREKCRLKLKALNIRGTLQRELMI